MGCLFSPALQCLLVGSRCVCPCVTKANNLRTHSSRLAKNHFASLCCSRAPARLIHSAALQAWRQQRAGARFGPTCFLLPGAPGAAKRPHKLKLCGGRS